MTIRCLFLEGLELKVLLLDVCMTKSARSAMLYHLTINIIKTISIGLILQDRQIILLLIRQVASFIQITLLLLSTTRQIENFIIQTKIVMFQMKATHQDQKRVGQFTKKINYSSLLEINSNSANYFSEQFLANIKSQIGQKTKPSKSILQALKHSNTQLVEYKKQIQGLKAHVQELSNQKKELLQTIDKLNYSQVQTKIQQEKTKKNKAPTISFSKFIHLEEKGESFELQMLKEKINHFDEYKKIKEARFTQIIDKQSKLMGEIDILKFKNSTLNQRVTCLQEIIKRLSSQSAGQRQKKEIAQAKNESNESQFVKNYVNIENQSETQNNSLLKIGGQGKIRRHSLVMSCTKNVEIQQQYNIQELACKTIEPKQSRNSDFLEIDGLLQQYAPITKTQSNIESRKQLNSQVVEGNLQMQSQIVIQIEK